MKHLNEKTFLNKVFVYGTLLDIDVLETVLTAPLSIHDLGTYALDDYQAVLALNEVFPILISKPGHKIYGQVIEVSNKDLLRLDYYEGEGYNRVEAMVSSNDITINVFVYMPNELLNFSSIEWNIKEFSTHFKNAFILKTKDYMLTFKG